MQPTIPFSENEFLPLLNNREVAAAALRVTESSLRFNTLQLIRLIQHYDDKIANIIVKNPHLLAVLFQENISHEILNRLIDKLQSLAFVLVDNTLDLEHKRGIPLLNSQQLIQIHYNRQTPEEVKTKISIFLLEKNQNELFLKSEEITNLVTEEVAHYFLSVIKSTGNTNYPTKMLILICLKTASACPNDIIALLQKQTVMNQMQSKILLELCHKQQTLRDYILANHAGKLNSNDKLSLATTSLDSRLMLSTPQRNELFNSISFDAIDDKLVLSYLKYCTPQQKQTAYAKSMNRISKIIPQNQFLEFALEIRANFDFNKAFACLVENHNVNHSELNEFIALNVRNLPNDILELLVAEAIKGATAVYPTTTLERIMNADTRCEAIIKKSPRYERYASLELQRTSVKPTKDRGASEYDYLFKYLIIGDSAVGKTSLLLRYADDEYNESNLYCHTLPDFKIRTTEENDVISKLQIWDTAGQERFKTISKSNYRGCHAVFLVVDLTAKESIANIKNWIAEARLHAPKDTMLCLVGSKADLINLRIYKYEEMVEFAESLKMPYFETSAKTGAGVEALFTEMTKNVVRQKTMPSTQINKLGIDESKIKANLPKISLRFSKPLIEANFGELKKAIADAFLDYAGVSNSILSLVQSTTRYATRHHVNATLNIATEINKLQNTLDLNNNYTQIYQILKNNIDAIINKAGSADPHLSGQFARLCVDVHDQVNDWRFATLTSKNNLKQ